MNTWLILLQNSNSPSYDMMIFFHDFIMIILIFITILIFFIMSSLIFNNLTNFLLESSKKYLLESHSIELIWTKKFYQYLF